MRIFSRSFRSDEGGTRKSEFTRVNYELSVLTESPQKVSENDKNENNHSNSVEYADHRVLRGP